MAPPNTNRTGGLAWAQRSKGALTAKERRRMLGEVARAQGAYLAGRIKFAIGRAPAAGLRAADLAPPDSTFCRAVEEACREQPDQIVGHSYRSWMFGSGLAAVDAAELDPELFYAGCLLHDYGIADPVEGEDFTLRSAKRLEQCGQEVRMGEAAVALTADAITVHTTPGISPERDGSLGFYLQAGAMFDLAGLRAADLDRAFRENVIRQHPRAGVTATVVEMIRAEARANPSGRFALLRRCGLLTLIKMNPLRPS